MARSGLSVRALVVLVLAQVAAGCGHYVTPGRRADFAALGIEAVKAGERDSGIESRMARRPAAQFPATIAVARIQAPDYRSHSYTSPPTPMGKCLVITLRDVEPEADLKKLASLPQVAGLAPVNRLVVPEGIDGERDLRAMAAAVQADMLLLYTFETVFESDTVVPALGTITLGIFPSERARVTSTASAALLDTRTGYVYALAETTVKDGQLANRWNTTDALEQSRRRAEGAAFGKLVEELRQAWVGVVEKHAGAGGGGHGVTSAAVSPR